MRFVENKVLVYTQLVLINNQRLHDLDKVAVGRNYSVICKRWTSEAMACIAESKIIRFMGNPGIRGGFSMHDPVFTTWLHLSMLVNLNTHLIIPKQLPVDAQHGEAINVNILPMCRPNNCNLQAVIGALEQKMLPQNHPAHYNEHANYRYNKSFGGCTEGKDTFFETHNSAHRLIEDHLLALNAKLYSCSCQMASLCENDYGYIAIGR
jgi:hypothetical protein